MKRLSNKQAIKIFNEKQARYRAFKKIELEYDKRNDKWKEARRISEIYKGRAIYVSQGLGGRIEASGISNSRTVFASHMSYSHAWTVDCYQNGRTTMRYVHMGKRADLFIAIKEYLITGKWNDLPEPWVEQREPKRKK